MKSSILLLTGLLLFISLLSCTKTRYACRNCDEPVETPDGAGSVRETMSAPDSYSGSGDCVSGSYTVKHLNEFNYTFSYRIGNGRMEDFSFTHSFSFNQPVNTGSLVFKNMGYNDDTKKISILISYQVAFSELVLTGYDSANNPIYETKKKTRTVEFIDVINTCDNTFVIG